MQLRTVLFSNKLILYRILLEEDGTWLVRKISRQSIEIDT